MVDKRFIRSLVVFAVIGILTAFTTITGPLPAARAQLLLSGFYNTVGSEYLYNFQVENQTGMDVLVIDALIPATPGMTYTSNAVAPSGYQINIDEGTGSLVLAADSSVFADNSTVGGFSFFSTQLIPSSTFTALDSNGSTLSGSFISVAVPEVGSLSLLSISLITLIVVCLIRRRFILSAGQGRLCTSR